MNLLEPLKKCFSVNLGYVCISCRQNIFIVRKITFYYSGYDLYFFCTELNMFLVQHNLNIFIFVYDLFNLAYRTLWYCYSLESFQTIISF